MGERMRMLEARKKQAEKLARARAIMMKKKAGQPVEDEPEEDEEMAEEKKDDDDEESIELTDEEKKLWYRKSTAPDLSDAALASSFASFTLPSSEEGFESITY